MTINMLIPKKKPAQSMGQFFLMLMFFVPINVLSIFEKIPVAPYVIAIVFAASVLFWLLRGFLWTLYGPTKQPENS
jgi:hypothetical protein